MVLLQVLSWVLLLPFVPFLRTCSQPSSLVADSFPTIQRRGTPWWLGELAESIFSPVNHIDIINGEEARDGIMQLLVSPLLQQRTVRWYSAEPTALCMYQNWPFSGLAIDTECHMEDDRFERFRLHWTANSYGGYIIIGNLSLTTMVANYACLFGPTGTYLFMGTSTEGQQQDPQLLTLLRLIWYKRGAFRVYVQLPSEIVTYNPFQPPSSPSSPLEYGAVVSIVSRDTLPTVPMVDFRGYPLRVEVFRSVYSNPITNEQQNRSRSKQGVTIYRGADVTARDVFQQVLNVTIVHVPADKDLFGDRLINGSFTGALGRLVRREVDIVFTSFFIKDYSTRDIEFTASVYSDAVCCLVKKASRIPEALLPLYIFPIDIWGLLVLLGVFSALCWTILRRSVRHVRMYHLRQPLWSRHHRFAVLFNLSRSMRHAGGVREAVQLLIDAFILLLSAPYQRFTRSGVERLFLTGLMLVSLIFVSLYQSGLAAVFVNPIYYSDISTLLQLEASGMAIPVKYRGFLDDVFPSNYSRLMDALRGRMQHLRVAESMLTRVARLGTIATVTRKTTLTLDNAIYMTTRQLHLVPECPRTYNLAYVTPFQSVFGERFNRLLLRLAAGGLIDHWIDEMRYQWTLRDRPIVQRMMESDFKVLTVLDMQFAFYVLGIGLALSSSAITLELLHFRRRVLDRN